MFSSALGKLDDALRINRQVLTELGLQLPFPLGELSESEAAEAAKLPVTMDNLGRLPYSRELVELLMREVEAKLGARSIPSLIDTLPACTDPIDQAISSLISSVIAPVFFTITITVGALCDRLPPFIGARHQRVGFAHDVSLAAMYSATQRSPVAPLS